MSSYLVPNITYAGTTPLFGSGGGGDPADWSLYPALTTVDINNNNLLNVNEIQAVQTLTGSLTTFDTISSNIISDSLINSANIISSNVNILNVLSVLGGKIILKNTDAPPLSKLEATTINTLEATTGDLFFNGNIIKTGDNVTSLNALQNIVTISSTNDNLTIAEVDNDIQLTVLAGGIGVESLNTLVSNINLTSTGGSVAITTVDNNINLEAIPPPAGGVTSLNLNTGAVSIVGTGIANDVLVTANNINPIIISAPGIATAIADAAAAQATANTAQATANTAQTTANTAITNAAAASAAAAAASAAAAIADSTAIAAGAAAATANAGVATIASSYVTQIIAGTNVTISPTGGTGAVTINAPVYQATYYKSIQQNLLNPDTDITFDLTGAWNNTNGYITHVNGTKDFTVVHTGLYQLEFNISINANGATWNTGVNKVVSIDITRPTIAEQAVIQNSSSVANSLSYQQSVVTTYYLLAGDVINLRSTLAYASATPFAVGLLNTFDLNTFFSWRFIS